MWLIKFFFNVANFKYYGKPLANKNYWHQEDKERLKSGENLPPFLPESFTRHLSSPLGPVSLNIDKAARRYGAVCATVELSGLTGILNAAAGSAFKCEHTFTGSVNICGSVHNRSQPSTTVHPRLCFHLLNIAVVLNG
jgi:hypothetical protein